MEATAAIKYLEQQQLLSRQSISKDTETSAVVLVAVLAASAINAINVRVDNEEVELAN